ncbi:putative secreted protein [Rhodobium orientis]|uniref:DUF1467 domain-containing protein n=1 Tax=Rhodobium orientis TaxID=34017 RepID=A0A327JT43_9HYPH|nr:DUF1467 family protein [Rhodobium orientis]MBB4302431.1 putative secreted protein [Rhodobium orientis]MBK5949282.1 hypothetical protein [Rhodobium orientis]RAI28666.1 hypothetical protein CH339_05950 [Rhodobium orientis]
MSFWSALAIYFIIWWVVLFAVLPFGVRTQAEEDDIVPGSAPSAPARPMLIRKFLATTVVAGLIFAGLYALWAAGFRIDDIPLPGPR